jgi:hypothetical protein
MNRTFVMVITLIGASAAPDLLAQTSGDVNAFAALRQTPIGALTPLVTPAMSERRLNGVQLGLRYGFSSDNSARTQAFAATAMMAPNLASTFTLTAGVLTADCVNCSASLMLGVGGDARVYEGGDAASGASLTLAISGDVGYSRLRQTDADALALAIGLPVTLSFPTGGTQGLHISPYFTPSFGIGGLRMDCAALNASLGGCDTNGSRWLMGGGVGVWNPTTNVSASLGVNRVMLQGAETVYGINVVIGGR